MLIDIALGFLISFGVNSMLRPVLRRSGWIDSPGERKLHARPTVISGGLGLFLAVAIGLLLLQVQATSILPSLAAVALMFFTGFLDDHTPIRARYRLIVQVVASFALVVATGAVVPNLEIWKNTDIAALPGFAIAISMLWMVGLINAVNMSDGSDGVSSGYGAIALIGILAFHGLSGSTPALSTPVAHSTQLLLLGGIFAFFLFNYPLRRGRHAIAFLGDGGSMMLGIVVGWALLKAGLPSGTDKPLSLWYAAWLIALPGFDATYCVVRRMLNGKDPTTPDRQHLHHLLKAYGFSKRRLAVTLHFTALILASFGIFLWYRGVPEYAAFWLLAGALIIYSSVVTVAWNLLAASSSTRQFNATPSTSVGSERG